MPYAVLINTHTSARQLKRVVDKLDNGSFHFYIHVDKKIDLKYYTQVLDTKNVFFVKKRVHVTHGGYSALQATLNGIDQIIKTGIDYDYITLLNGGDYPIKNAAEIAAFLTVNKGKQFISFNSKWAKKHADYTNRYHLADHHFPGKKIMEKFMNLLMRRPHAPRNLNLVGGSSNWIITLNCARYVLIYIERFKFHGFLKHTKYADRFIFQSIIMNSSFKADVVNNNYRYAEQIEGSSRIKTLTIKDFYNITTSDCLFAGRFDIREDEKILSMLDQAAKGDMLNLIQA